MGAESSKQTFPSPEARCPEDWSLSPLAEVADVRFSSVDKLTRSSEVPVRLCNYIDVYKNQYITRDLEFMQASATRPEIERYGLQVGDVIITKDSETPNDIGIPAVVDYAAPDLLCGYHLAIVRARSESVDPTFLAKQLAHHRVASYFGRQANGLTRYGLPLAAVQKTPLWLPCRCEQSAIGTLLRLVDEAIAESDAVVAKLRFISSGLLRDLLTRGVDDNGELRDPLTDPAGFKDCSLGRFPVTWDVKPIEELLLPGPNAMRSGPFGSALLKQELKESGIPLLGIDNVQVEQFVSSFTRFVDEQKFQELRRYAVRPRDIMITIMGTVGRCCVVPNDISVALSSKHVWTISLDESRYSPFVACWQINFAPWVLRQFKRDEQGGVMTAIRSETLRNLLLPVPPMPEMRIIERLLLESKAQINHQVSVLSKLKMLRLGLASDLLSGYVRVPRSFVREEASV